jgi:ADP-ribose pyrophosphatase YjhB (NUDIX family)
MFLYYVPTTTILAKHPRNPFYVCALRPTDKHEGKLVLPGGRFEADSASILQGNAESLVGTGIRELDEEVSLELEESAVFAIKTDPIADIRRVTLGKVTFNKCPIEMINLEVIAAYGMPDVIIEGFATTDTPQAKDGEAKEVLWFDIRDHQLATSPEESKWGVHHDLIIEVYWRRLLGTWTACPNDFLDVAALRDKLLRLPR